MFNFKEESFMQRALDLADLPNRCLLPNPRVGAVIIRNGEIVGEGLHEGPGSPHAEVKAIQSAEKRGIKKFNQCELFVSLEPCCHTNKRTPPCAPLVIEKKFKRVVVAVRDPNPKVRGKGIQSMKKAGIQVDEGCLDEKALLLNQSFFKNQIEKLPYITLKIAQTFDGRMFDDYRQSQWITSSDARLDVHHIRSRVDAIAVGAKTVDTDNPKLNARWGLRDQPKKVIIFGKPKIKIEKTKAAKTNGLENIYSLSSDKPLKEHLKSLFQKGICHILLEGGPKIASQFLAEGLVDQLIIYYGRGILGGKRLGSIGNDWGLRSLQKSINFRPLEAQLCGPDVKVNGLIHVYRNHSTNRHFKRD